MNKRRTKYTRTYDFLTLYTELPHDKVKSKLQQCYNNAIVYWWKEAKGRNTFGKASLKTDVNYLIENC